MKSKIFSVILRSIFLMLALAAFPAFAQQDTNFANAEWAYVDAKKVTAAAAEITAVQYSNCDSVVVEQNSVRDYAADGTGP